MQPVDYCHFLCVRKPIGITSFAAVSRVRRLAGTRRVGHLGTLDPMAEGVLPIALGRATRLIEYVSGDKRYLAEATLGVVTDTLDAQGEVLERRDASHIDEAMVSAALGELAVRTTQIPPMASALHHDGRRLYEIFREGGTVEVPPRPVRVDAITLVSMRAPRVVFDVSCGAGTYIRSLARDLGELLGCGAHLSALSRLRRGPFSLDDAASFEQLEADGLTPWLLEPHRVLDGLPWVSVSEGDAGSLRQGKRIAFGGDEAMLVTSPVEAGAPAEAGSADVTSDEGRVVAVSALRGELVAVARLVAGVLSPIKVFGAQGGGSS